MHFLQGFLQLWIPFAEGSNKGFRIYSDFFKFGMRFSKVLIILKKRIKNIVLVPMGMDLLVCAPGNLLNEGKAFLLLFLASFFHKFKIDEPRDGDFVLFAQIKCCFCCIVIPEIPINAEGKNI